MLKIVWKMSFEKKKYKIMFRFLLTGLAYENKLQTV